MSLTLSLLPFDADSPASRYSHTILPVSIPRFLRAAMDQRQVVEYPLLDRPLNGYMSRNRKGAVVYGEMTTTPYGEPLTYVLAGDLVQFSDEDFVAMDYKNRAAWAYLEQLPKTTKVALYWS